MSGGERAKVRSLSIDWQCQQAAVLFTAPPLHVQKALEITQNVAALRKKFQAASGRMVSFFTARLLTSSENGPSTPRFRNVLPLYDWLNSYTAYLAHFTSFHQPIIRSIRCASKAAFAPPPNDVKDTDEISTSRSDARLGGMLLSTSRKRRRRHKRRLYLCGNECVRSTSYNHQRY